MHLELDCWSGLVVLGCLSGKSGHQRACTNKKSAERHNNNEDTSLNTTNRSMKVIRLFYCKPSTVFLTLSVGAV